MRFILLHSPLTGPAAWAPTAAVLAARGVEVTRPVIPPMVALASPLYESAARAVAAQVLSQGGPFVLVVHSAAGGLAPAVVAACGDQVRGVLYVDAVPPYPGRCWFETAGDGLVASLKAKVANGLVPAWDQWFPPGALESLLPEGDLRARFTEELVPTPLSWFEEQAPELELPDNVGWGFLRLSKAYEREAGDARRLGWPTLRRDLHHLAVATHPEEVVGAMLALTRLLGLKVGA
jgi:pimeloyl-ACP methyl ester carboxylesterase